MDLTEDQWRAVEKFIPTDRVREDRRGDRGAIGAVFSMASCGFCAPVRLGTTCPSVMVRIRRCIGASSLAQEWSDGAVLRGLARDLHE